MRGGLAGLSKTRRNERTGFLICNVDYFLEQNNGIIEIKI